MPMPALNLTGNGVGVDVPDKVDVIVTEIFDSELLGEGILPTMRDATSRLLKVKP